VASGQWWGHGCEAHVVGDEVTATLGVELFRSPKLAAYHCHVMDGTYDALSLAEKHHLSGDCGTVETWLLSFDRCGKPRPGNGCR
jgi:hypothetical protein